MARYAYDVNTTTRLLDVHKQFRGGLKTVDTDDSLGAVFLRQAQNISLSEFGFIEKRYGTYENTKIPSSITNLQGYWEYMPEDTHYTIYAADGNFYVNNQKVNFLYKENKDWRYPTDVYNASPENAVCTTNNLDGNYIVYSPTRQDPSQTEPECGSLRVTYYNQCSPVDGTGASQWRCVLKELIPEIPYEADFQTTRDVNAIEIKNVLYIFNGTYPVYAKEVEGELKFFLFSVDIPTYSEYVVVSNNLLEDNYNELYFQDFVNIGNNQANLEEPDTFSDGPVVKQIKQTSFPKFPYAVDDEDPNFNGLMTFKSSFQYVPQLLSEYPTGDYYRLNVVSSAYRNSGIGASDFDFIPINQNDVTFPKMSNLSTGNTYNVIGKFVEPQNKIADKIGFEQALGEVIATQDYNILPFQVTFAKTKISFKQDFAPSFLEDNKDKAVYFSFTHKTNNIDGDLVQYSLEELSLVNQGFNVTAGGDPIDEILLADNEFFYLEEGGHAIGERYFDIVPYRVFDGERIYFEEETIKVQADVLEKNYAFVVPSLDNVSSTVEGYEVRFVGVILTLDDRDSNFWRNVFYDSENDEGKFNYSTSVLTEYPASYVWNDGEPGSDNVTTNVTWVRDIGIIEPLEVTEKNFTDPFEVTLKNLIAGTYDFKFRIAVSRYILTDNFLKIEETNFVDFLFYNKSITIEKIQDYPGSEGVSVIPEAIYTCNRVMEHFNKLLIWGSKKMPNSVFFSFPDRPTYFPQNFYLNFGDDKRDPVVAVTPYMNILVVQTPNTTWGVRGNSGLIDSPSPYVPFTINTTVGTIAPKSVRPVRNHLFFLSKIGIIALKSLYAADEQYNIDFMDRNIRNIVPQDPDAVGVQYDNQYWLNFPNFGITLRWYIDKKAWVLDSFGAYTNRITQNYVTKPGAWNEFNGVFKWQVIDGQLEFISHISRLNESENLSIYKIGIDYSLPTDLGENVFTKFETSFLNQNYPFHPKNYKELKLDFTIQNEYNASDKFVYGMDENEHIVDDVHKIDNIKLIKNHRYRLIYNFSQHSTEEDTLDGGSFTQNIYDIINGDNFDFNTHILIGGYTFSLLSPQDLQITSVKITDKNNEEIVLLPNEGFTIVEDPVNYNEYVEFLLPNYIDGIVDIIINGKFSIYNDGAVMYDITYDNNLKIKNWVVSENATLNIESYDSYDPSQVELDLDFDSTLGNWVFGSSDFGNKVTAVKTVKLSGKGYNAKLYLEDETKSKWTLESLGLTYKMKRARSR